jgi:hypothetical protein
VSSNGDGTLLQLQPVSTTKTVQVFAPIPKAAWQETGSIQVTTWKPVDEETRFETIVVAPSTSHYTPSRPHAESTDIPLDVLSETGERIPWLDGTRESAALIGTGVIATTGYVLLNSRLGLWVLSLLTSQPLWQQFDPLEVLYAWDERKQETERDGDDEETLVTLVEEW